MLKFCERCGKKIEVKGREKYCVDCRPQARKQYFRWYTATNEKFREKRRVYMRKYMQRYYKNQDNRQKHLVREKSNNKQKSGRIAPGCKCNYPGCNETENLVKHHIRYDMQNAEYCFITFCRKHHYIIHHEGGENE